MNTPKTCPTRPFEPLNQPCIERAAGRCTQDCNQGRNCTCAECATLCNEPGRAALLRLLGLFGLAVSLVGAVVFLLWVLPTSAWLVLRGGL